MTDKLRTAAQQALTMIEATLGNLTAAEKQGLITGTIWFSWDGTLFDYLASEAEALRAALAEQPAEQEPVAWYGYDTKGKLHFFDNPGELGLRHPLYTAPQPAIPSGCVAVSRAVLNKLGVCNAVIDTIARAAPEAPQPAKREPLTPRELELIDGMITAQLNHAERCDAIANRRMAERQKEWDLERVALLQKIRTHGIGGQP